MSAFAPTAEQEPMSRMVDELIAAIADDTTAADLRQELAFRDAEAGQHSSHHTIAALERLQDPGREPGADHTGEGKDHPRSGLGAIRPTAESHRPAPDETPSGS